MAAVRPFGFLKVGNFNVWFGGNMRHLVKFHANQSHRCEDMANYQFSRWRPSDILYLFHACLDHPQRVLGGLCHCAKFGWNQCSNFDNMQVLIFCALSTPCGAGVPPFRVCSSLVRSLCHLLLCITFSLFLFSFTLLIFFYCSSDSFLPESSHSVSECEVVGGDQTWV